MRIVSFEYNLIYCLMQQIKIKSFRKKKNLTIESIKIEIFEKNSDLLQRRYKTVDQTQKVTIFTHSKRYLQSIVPRKVDEKEQIKLGKPFDDEKAQNSKIKQIMKERNDSPYIKRRIFVGKQINRLKVAIKRNIFSHQNDQIQRVNKKIEGRQLKCQNFIRNDIQIAESYSQNIKRLKTDYDFIASNTQEVKYSRAGFHNSDKSSLLLKPLNISVDLPRFLLKSNKNNKIKELQDVLLQQNRYSFKISQGLDKYDKKRQTQISPWRSHQSQMQDHFSQI